MHRSVMYGMLGPHKKPTWWQWSITHKESQDTSVRNRRDQIFQGLIRTLKKFGIDFSFWVVQTTVSILDATCCFDSHNFLDVNK